MKLNKLGLINFKGISSFVISPNGKSISIYGDNTNTKHNEGDTSNCLSLLTVARLS